jgi:Rieske [2Fe-2S] domain
MNTNDNRAPLKLEGLADGSTPKNPAAQALGRLGGSANTAAQRRQRREAAKNAGRPRRVCVHCAQPVVGGHLDRDLDATCGAHGWRWDRAGVRHPAPVSRERAALDAIAEALAVAVERNIDPSFDAIARALRSTGRKVRRPRR